MTDPAKRELNLWQRILYSAGEMGVSLSPGVVVGWLLYFYTGQVDEAGNKIYIVGYGAFAAINFIGRMVDSIADPFVGYISDKYPTRWGRRIPWVVIGAPFLSLFSIMLWYPPSDPGSWANVIWLTVGLAGFWFFFTAVVAPYLAMLPEITYHNDERIEISTYMGYFDVLGMLIGTVFIAFLIEGFSNGIDIGPFHIPDGYKLAGWIFGIAMILFYWVSVVKVREKPMSQEKIVPFKFWEAFGHCLRNKAFIPYVLSVSFFRVAIDVLIAIIPFMVTVVIGYKEGVAGLLQGAIVVLSLPLFPLVYKLSVKMGKKKVYLFSQGLFAAAVPFIATMKDFPIFGWGFHNLFYKLGMGGMSESAIILSHVSVVFLFILFPVACVFVLPRAIFTDIIDVDAQKTGYRREAMYMGMEGLISKFAAGLSVVIAPLLLKYAGDTADNPNGILLAGPVAGFLLALGYIAFRYYPIEK